MVMTAEIEASSNKRQEKIARDFTHLYEKSKQLFNGLRELPQFGHQQWKSYYARAFDIHTQLWRFQQQHRGVLEKAVKLQRWQIGDIASRIAQLYYHYYLRTSDPNYLKESFSFYSAIRNRRYFSDSSDKADALDLSLKKLRYFVRFLLVCVLLRKHDALEDVMTEMEKEVRRYTIVHVGPNAKEWMEFLDKLREFMSCVNVVNIIQNGRTVDLQNVRALPLIPQLKPKPSHEQIAAVVIETTWIEQLSSQHSLRLTEAVIVGNAFDQNKFGELTIDMYRMLMVLEREPTVDSNQNHVSLGKTSAEPDSGGLLPTVAGNPHKFLLFKPSFSEIQAFISASLKELSSTGVMLLYLSMDGMECKDRGVSIPPPRTSGVKLNTSRVGSNNNNNNKDDTPLLSIIARQRGSAGYAMGGLMTNLSREVISSAGSHLKDQFSPKDPHCLYPGDLYCFTRRPMFLIVDSDNALAFQNFPNIFGQPLVILLSAELLPAAFQDNRSHGNLLTLFLHHPLVALCWVCDVLELGKCVWEQLDRCLTRFFFECVTILIRCKSLPSSFRDFMGDGYLLSLILRFVFCGVALRLHRAFNGDRFYPSSQPDLVDTTGVFHSPTLQKCVLDMAALLNSKELFATADDLSTVEARL